VLRDKHKLLGGAIKPEVYYYGFLRSWNFFKNKS
jgi:hypothetical protein